MIRLREERFRVLAVDVRKQLIRAKTIAVGSLADCAVHPRELFRFLISVSAHGFIAVHNHPSGDPSPSNEDRELTGRLHKAGQLMGIPMIDHVVVARRGTFSFVAGGLL
jgi:DNA repair protein RadC